MTTTKKKTASDVATVSSSQATDTSHAAETMPSTPVTHPSIAVTPATPVAPTVTWIQLCTTLLTQIEKAVPPGDALTASDKKRRAKARKGSEQHIPTLVALAKQFGVRLALVPTEAIESSSAEAQQLVPLLMQVGRVTKQLNDRVFQSRGGAWSGSAKLYAVLRRLAKDNGDLAAGLAPVETFFNHRHPSVAKNHPKTKKGKAALEAQKALVGKGVSATPASTPETPVVTSATPVLVPATPVVASPVVAVNGAEGANGIAHS